MYKKFAFYDSPHLFSKLWNNYDNISISVDKGVEMC